MEFKRRRIYKWLIIFKIYSYKAYKFERKEAGKTVESVDVPPLLSTVPSWVRNSALFNWALKKESIVVVEAKSTEKNTTSELEQLKAEPKSLE